MLYYSPDPVVCTLWGSGNETTTLHLAVTVCMYTSGCVVARFTMHSVDTFYLFECDTLGNSIHHCYSCTHKKTGAMNNGSTYSYAEGDTGF